MICRPLESAFSLSPPVAKLNGTLIRLSLTRSVHRYDPSKLLKINCFRNDAIIYYLFIINLSIVGYKDRIAKIKR